MTETSWGKLRKSFGIWWTSLKRFGHDGPWQEPKWRLGVIEWPKNATLRWKRGTDVGLDEPS